MNLDWLHPEQLDRVPGLNRPETAHIDVCERPLSECGVCHTWWREVLTAVRDGRVAVPEETEQTELPI